MKKETLIPEIINEEIKIGETITLEELSQKLEEHYSLENQKKRIATYFSILVPQISINLDRNLNSLTMTNVWAYLDINEEGSDSLMNMYKTVAGLLDIDLRVRRNENEEIDEVTYSW